MTRPPTVTYQQLCQLVDGYEGLADEHGLLVRADIADLQITVRVIDATPRRGRIVAETGYQLMSQDSAARPLVGCRAHHPDLGLCRTADLLVVTEDALDGQPDDFAVFGPEVSAAIEVSSSDDAHSTPPRAYARMGVPVYVHIDPRDGTIAVHSSPDTAAAEPHYRDTPRTYKFGDTGPLGKWTIETSRFRKYTDQTVVGSLRDRGAGARL